MARWMCQLGQPPPRIGASAEPRRQPRPIRGDAAAAGSSGPRYRKSKSLRSRGQSLPRSAGLRAIGCSVGDRQESTHCGCSGNSLGLPSSASIAPYRARVSSQGCAARVSVRNRCAVGCLGAAAVAMSVLAPIIARLPTGRYLLSSRSTHALPWRLFPRRRSRWSEHGSASRYSFAPVRSSALAFVGRSMPHGSYGAANPWRR
jgi:hypothetical protein